MYITTVVILAPPRLTFLRGWRIYKSIRTHRWPQTFIQLLCFCFRSLCFLLLLPSFVSFFLHFLDKMNVLGKWQVACGNWSVWQVSVVGSNVKWRASDSERLPHTCSQESNDACPANKFRPVGSLFFCCSSPCGMWMHWQLQFTVALLLLQIAKWCSICLIEYDNDICTIYTWYVCGLSCSRIYKLNNVLWDQDLLILRATNEFFAAQWFKDILLVFILVKVV